MSLSGLCPTRIKADRVISTFSFNLASSRAHRIPIEGESVGRRVKEQQNATRGLCQPCHKQWDRIPFEHPYYRAHQAITRAIEASNVASTPPVAKTANGVTVTKTSRPLTESPPCAGARGRSDLQRNRTYGRRTIAKILRKEYVRIQE